MGLWEANDFEELRYPPYREEIDSMIGNGIDDG